MRALLIITTSAIVLLLCLSSAARADVKVTVTYTDLAHEVSPNNVTIRTAERKRELIMTSDHKIQSTFESGGNSETGTVEFGKRYQSRDLTGRVFNGRWSIEKGAIVHVSSAESQLQTLTISTNGTDSCTATIQYILKKGHKLFEGKIKEGYAQFDELHAENIVCTIAAVRR
jgi:hypothetical protein